MNEQRKSAKGGPPPLEPLTGPARREAERQRRAKGEKAAFYRSLALLGTLGWLIVAPLLVGMFGGRWLDHWTGGGVRWTLGGAAAGLAFGTWMAWRKLAESEEEERRAEKEAESGDDGDRT